VVERRRRYWKGTLEEYVQFLEEKQAARVREAKVPTGQRQREGLLWCGHERGKKCDCGRAPFVHQTSSYVMVNGERHCKIHGNADMRLKRSKKGKSHDAHVCGICDNIKAKARYARAKERRADA